MDKKIEAKCDCCEAWVHIVVIKKPTDDPELEDSIMFPEGIFCPFCSSYIEIED